MTFDKIPWFLAGSVQHPVEVARTMAYVALSGQEGVVGAQDMKVSALATPSMNVQVAVGACGILNRDPGGSYQAFTARHGTPSNVSIAAAGASPRYDLLVARVEDPYFPGSTWDNPDPQGTNPAARQNWDYTKLRIISGVSSTVRSVADAGLTQSAIALALITVPAGATSILNANIIDLRKPATASASASGGGGSVGDIKMFAGDIIPEGWLMCDGSTFDSSLYPALGSVVGTKFGGAVGNNRTLPDFRRRVPQGVGPGVSIGTDDGQPDPASRTRNFAYDHIHGGADHLHGVSVSIGNATLTKKDRTALTNAQDGADRLEGPAVHSHTASASVGGSDRSLNTGTAGPSLYRMEPHLTVAFIIKAI